MVTEATSLERVLEPGVSNSEDRRFAARELLGFLVRADGGRRRLSNVGSLARIKVADKSAGSSRTAPPRTRPLFTSAPARGDQAVIGSQGSDRRAGLARGLGRVVLVRISCVCRGRGA
jgi:hypothetical protein